MKMRIVDNPKIEIPEAQVPLGKWLEAHGGEVSFSCNGGLWCARVSWKKLHSYSDDQGEHSEKWSVARYHKDLMQALSLATDAAAQIARAASK